MSYSNNSECICDTSYDACIPTINDAIPYYTPFLVHNYIVYSIDRIHIIFFIEESFYNEIINNENCLKKYIPNATTKGLNLCCNHYYQTYNIKFGNSSMTVKLLLQLRSITYQCSLEVNPNQCFGDNKCKETIEFFLSKSTKYYIRTIDVAIDIPLPRNFFRLQKDRRRKLTTQYSKKNSTEYCGKRNNPGYCKLYDKACEMGLKQPLTRIEITYGNPLHKDFFKDIIIKLPIIKVQTSDFNPTETNDKLSSTDKVLIALFQKIQDKEFKSLQFKQLDYKKQKRLKHAIFADEKDFIFDTDAIILVINRIIEKISPSYYVSENTDFINKHFI